MINHVYALSAQATTAAGTTAAAASTGTPMSPLISLLLYVILFGAIMYFFMIMPQKKRERKAKEMISNLKLNARVVTIGGIFGKIVDVQEDEVTIETGIEKAKVTMKKWAVREVLSDDQA